MAGEENIKKIVPIMMEESGLIKSHSSQQEKKMAKKTSFEKIVPRIIEKGFENVNLSMFNEEMKKEILQAAGDEYVKRGMMTNAIKVFAIISNTKRLVEIGIKFEDETNYKGAIEAYSLAKADHKLLALGEKCLKIGNLSDASRAFMSLNEKDKLNQVAEEWFNRERFDYSIEIFNQIGNKEKLIEVGDDCLEKRQYAYAARAFELAQDQDRLNKLADICFKEGLLSTSFKLYKLAENEIMVQFMIENFSDKNLSIDSGETNKDGME